MVQSLGWSIEYSVTLWDKVLSVMGWNIECNGMEY